MFWKRVIVLSLITTCVWSYPSPSTDSRLRHLLKADERLRRSSNGESSSDDQVMIPYSPRRLEKMLEKAILKIITGDLGNADMLFLKNLNYSLEEVLAIRERELGKKFNVEEHLENEKQNSEDVIESRKIVDKLPEAMDYEAYNRKAVEDYENIANKMEEEGIDGLDYNDPIVEEKKIKEKSNGGFHANFDRAMQPHVVFKIRYDDSEIDSSSFEKSKEHVMVDNIMKGMRILGKTYSSSSASSSGFDTAPDPSEASTSAPLPIILKTLNLSKFSANDSDSDPLITPDSSESTTVEDVRFNISDANEIEREMVSSGTKRVSEYEGLEWVEDDVYRVIPEALNYDLNNYEEENETMEAEYQSGNSSMDEMMMTNDYVGYQEDSGDVENGTRDRVVENYSGYQQLAVARRRDQAQSAMEDIKLRVLALTGRLNLSNNSNQIQRERLTMFSPTCQIPKNTDTETWADALTMNMYFQINLTSSDHIVAARLRIYKLPQTNLTVASSSALKDEEEEEKRIRISVYFYTKSVKKHRSKKRLMDSVVARLTPGGGHLALDVRQALRFWRQPSRTNHSTSNNNHGIVIQVEDQDGRPLKPALYIQQDACHTDDEDTDEKAYQRVPAIFLQACSRYVRVVNGEAVTYVNCKNLRNSQQ